MAKRKTSLGERIRAARVAMGLSVTTLSEKSGVSARLLAYYESGANEPGAARVIAIADALEMTCDELLGVSGKKFQKIA